MKDALSPNAGKCMLDPCTFPVTVHTLARYLDFVLQKSTVLQCFWVHCSENGIGMVRKILFALPKGLENIFVHVNFVLLTNSLSMSQVFIEQKSTQNLVKKYIDSAILHGAKRNCNGLFGVT
jgi:hypothetical protein